AQRAIERVYYSHQTGATLPVEQAVPQELLEHKVRTYLRESAALEKYYRSAITGEALRREAERIVASTRFPDRLREIDAALGHDPFLFEECFARPVLVERLLRSFYSHDARFSVPAAQGNVQDDRSAAADAHAPAGRSHPAAGISRPQGFEDWWRRV